MNKNILKISSLRSPKQLGHKNDQLVKYIEKIK